MLIQMYQEQAWYQFCTVICSKPQDAKARNCDAISNVLNFTNEVNTEEEKPAEDSNGYI